MHPPASHRHPLSPLQPADFSIARSVVTAARGPHVLLYFREIFLQEPLKNELIPYLIAEHSGKLASDLDAVRPPRRAKVQYDVISGHSHQYTQSIVDLDSVEEVQVVRAKPHQQPSEEYKAFENACFASSLFQAAVDEFLIPDYFTLKIDPWPYGGPDGSDELLLPRYMQGLVYAQDTRSGNPDSNHYSYPVPLIPVVDWTTRTIVRIDRLSLDPSRHGWISNPSSHTEKIAMFTNASPAEYVPELLPENIPLRTDMKPIAITQPEGTSFRVTTDGLVTWQKWRFRVSFTPREGAVLHDVVYDGRPIIYRLSFSEMTVPYGDPREPYHRKQAFDFGDGGIGRAANNLRLGCDCVGAIHYISALLATADGRSAESRNVVCLHEQDSGVGWKHSNFWTGRPIVTRLREFVVQFIITLANYEYVFAYKLDVTGNIGVEVRATGIVSIAPISPDVVTTTYGAIVAPGALAQNHQHIFAVRIDPVIDSYTSGHTRIVVEETHTDPIGVGLNIHGNGFSTRRRVVTRAEALDAAPEHNRIIRLENRFVQNSVSGRNVGYKFMPLPTQLLLAHPESRQAKRAQFATHHVWVTGHRDGELWAAGEYTNMSETETGGVRDMVDRGDWFVEDQEMLRESVNGVRSLIAVEEKPRGAGDERNPFGLTPQDQASPCLSSPVVWSVFGLTHLPRMEDWPVMPTEIHSFQFRPADFFTYNPALDVPPVPSATSVLVPAVIETQEKIGKTRAAERNGCCK
ncbi:Copper amine oxidase 1 [Ceratocystis fimbriata CBS 114723]|uniref:Amine oxidase n=1 Tax=Ceratocystis fimbriata CBS 114723 TaxID=1035309 RepID=A0A2C5XDF0_9PEZI|nr:Copper amine oxidase 1 [Ceratocystis fimbriata CBS 114723]